MSGTILRPNGHEELEVAQVVITQDGKVVASGSLIDGIRLGEELQIAHQRRIRGMVIGLLRDVGVHVLQSVLAADKLLERPLNGLPHTLELEADRLVVTLSHRLDTRWERKTEPEGVLV
jgi:hypothetical protein